MKEVEANAKVEAMMINLDLDKELLSKAKKTGVDRPPRVLGYYPLRPMGFIRNVTHLENELRERNVEFDSSWNVTQKCKLLKKHERKRFEAEVDAELQQQGLCDPTNNTLQKKLQQLEEHSSKTDSSFGGRFTVDIDRFFKKQSNLPDTMFENH